MYIIYIHTLYIKPNTPNKSNVPMMSDYQDVKHNILCTDLIKDPLYTVIWCNYSNLLVDEIMNSISQEAIAVSQ